MAALDETHDPYRKSWVASANAPDTDFPIQNLPLGVFRHRGGRPRGGVAIGSFIVDLGALIGTGLLAGTAASAARAASRSRLNPLMALGNPAASALRAGLSDLLRDDGPDSARAEALQDRFLVPMADAVMEVPAAIGDFSDFLCSYDHIARMARSRGGDVPPAFASLPIGYHSRASSVVISGTPARRPNGQYRTDGGLRFGPEPQLDFELELGAFVGPGNALGRPIPIDHARDHLFGYCLLNDWSARSIQGWESNPLGPFLAKSLSTTISPWVVTEAAMAPFRARAHAREPADAAPPHLTGVEDQAEGGLDLGMEVLFATAAMREAGHAPVRVTETNFTACYWTFGQMLTHHASNGCNLRPGDLMGSGTMSGPSDESRACLGELTERGKAPFTLPTGETRGWVEDGDEVIFRARAARDGCVPIGFGECRARLEPALPWPAE